MLTKGEIDILNTWIVDAMADSGREFVDVFAGKVEPEPMPDLRNAMGESSSGAESFFCSEVFCLMDKQDLLALSGLRKPGTCQSYLAGTGLVDHFMRDKLDNIAELQERLNKLRMAVEEEKVLIASLLEEMGYSDITFTPACDAVSGAKEHHHKYWNSSTR